LLFYIVFQASDTKTDRHPVDLLVWSPVCILMVIMQPL